MLKKTIEYTDFNGNECKEDFYFNLSKPELVNVGVSKEGGMEKYLIDVIKEDRIQEIVSLFSDLILKSYGIKSEDGKRFIKTPQLAEEFSQTEAYNVLYMELMSDNDAAVNFLKGIIPSDIASQLTDEKLQEASARLQG